MNIYAHQISYSQELPPYVLKDGVPFGVKQVASSPLRLISISEASKGKFTVLYPDGDTIKVREIYDYEKEDIDDNDLWQFIQIGWQGNIVLFKHVISGKYLCVPENSNSPKCHEYGKLKDNRYVWNLQDRTLFFMDPNQKYYVYTTNNKDIIPLTPLTIEESKTCLPKNANIITSLPINGKPFIRIQSDNTIIMSDVSSQYYSNNLPVFNPFWDSTNTIWNVGRGINDPENEWYYLLQRGRELEYLNLPPTSQPMGLGLLKNWEPNKRAADIYNRCNISLQNRFIDTKTQTKPDQKTPPKIMFGFTSGAQERLTEVQGSGFRENFEYWQYLDTFMFIAYNQGWPPPELKKLKVPVGLGINSNVSDNLFEVLEGFLALQGGGIFAMPPKTYIEAAHKNGVKVYSVLFFQQNDFGGKWKWWSEFLKNRDIYAKKLVDIADYYGIDGYFINFEAQPGGNPRDVDGSNCSMFSGCDKADCKGYWCTYTMSGAQNCDGNACSEGKWTDDNSNYGFDGQDINKDYFTDFLKKVRSYRNKKNINCDIGAYASMRAGGNSDNYTSGITQYFTDWWYDPITKESIVDFMLSMPPGGQNHPSYINYTFSHSQEATKGCVENYDNYGWPINTGPSVNKQSLSSSLSCGQSVCDIPLEKRQPGCTNNDSDKTTCENAGCCWAVNDNPKLYPFCYKKKEDVICPDNECGGVDITQSLIPKKRFLDFFVGTTAEKTFDNPNDWTYGYTSLDQPEPWDKYIYCGTFDNCNNYHEAITQPMSSFFLWQANLSQSNMGANNGRTYKMNTDLYQSLYSGKTGLVVHNLTTDPYTKVSDMGISNFVPEKSTLSELPFHTSFCLGNGENFYIDGEPQLYYGSWTDNIQDYLPTWRWWPRQMTIKNETGQYIESMILGLDYSRSYNGGSCLKIESISGMGNTDFYLYKTQFNMDKKLKLVVCASSINECDKLIKIGYTLGSQGNLVDNPQIHYFTIGTLNKKWKHFTFDIEAKSNDYISSICLFASKPQGESYKIFIGSISVIPDKFKHPKKPVIKSIDTYNVKDGTLNYRLKWKQQSNILYYNVFCGKYYIGRIYGSGTFKISHKYIYYNVSNQPKNNNTFWIEGVSTNGHKYSNKPLNPVLYFLLLCLFLGLVVYFIYYNMSNEIFRYGLIILIVLFFIIYISKLKFDISLTKNSGNYGELSNDGGLMIENWPYCKKKSFNINFDDNRPKTWTWLLEHVKKRNLPLKITFFINTLWLNRDLEKYKSWIKDYDVDYGAHGHWHMNHQQDNMPTPPGIQCWGDNPSDGCCSDGTQKYCVTDNDLANNDSSCANYIRKYIYDDMNKDLVFAYPYGALPFNSDGTPKKITFNTIKENFIAARHITWGQSLSFPIVSDPSSLLGGCANYQGQPAGCDGVCSVDSCSASILQNIYDSNVTKEVGPEFSWPGGIDLNLDPSCSNCTIIRQMEIRKKSLEKMLESEKPYAIMVWGHDFHPTNKDGKTYPCDKTYTLGQCEDNDISCKNNANAMAKETGVDDWIDDKDTYRCPIDIAKSDDSCAETCVRGAVVDGICTDKDIFKNAYNDPTGYYQSESFIPKDHPYDCSACADSCWNPSIGHKLLEMLELLNDRDDIWFGHFVEIVQYLYNRRFSKINFISNFNNISTYNLTTTSIMKKFPLTISLPLGSKNIEIDEKEQIIYHSKYSGKYYINFYPKDNTVHNIKVYY